MRSSSGSPEPPTCGWWGDGLAPWECWPGVSLEIQAEWVPDVAWTDRNDGERVGRWESHEGRFYFDDVAAQRPCDFAAYFQPTQGEHAGRPVEFLDWQRELIVRPLFGWLRADTGMRRFRNVYCEVAKKNGKSLVCSVLGPYLAFGDDEPGAQVYVAAGDEEQAKIVWGEARAMVQGSDEFMADLGVEALAHSLYQGRTNSSFKALTSKAATKHGFNVQALIFDELHAQKSRTLWETLVRGVSARRQPVILVITTAGSDRESICYEEHERAIAVRDGHRDEDYLLPVVFQMDEGDDWTDESVWHKVNPSLGVVKSLDYMRAECQAAQSEPRKRNDFLNLELTVWTESRTVWIQPEAWDACRVESPPGGLPKLVCCAGLDLSETIDLTAMVAAYRIPDARPAEEVEVEGEDSQVGRKVVAVDFSVYLRSWFWIPEGVWRERVRTREAGVPWDVWRRDGWLTVTGGVDDRGRPSEITDYRAVRLAILRDLMPSSKVHEIGFDPWNARQLATPLAEEDGVPMVEVRQGTGTLSAACKLLEALVRSGRLQHDGNPALAWCFRNAEITSDARGNICPVKPGGDKRSTRRIDGVMATVTALARLMVAPAPRPRRSGKVLWV